MDRLTSEKLTLKAQYNENLADLVALRSSTHEALKSQIEKINAVHSDNKLIAIEAVREEMKRSNAGAIQALKWQHQNQAETMTNEINKLKRELKESTDKYQIEVKMKELFQEKVTHLEDKNNKLTAEITTHQAEAALVAERNDHEKIKALEDELLELSSSLDTLKDGHAAEVSAMKAQHSKELSAAKEQMVGPLKDTIEQLEKSLEECRSSLSSAEEERSRLQEELDNEQESHEEEMENLKAKYKNADSTMRKLKDAEETIDRLKKEHSAKVKMLKSDCEEKGEKITELEASIQEQTSEYERLQDENEEIQDKVTSLEKKIALGASELKKAQAKVADVEKGHKAKVSALEKEIDLLKSRLNENKKRLHKSNTKILSFKQKIGIAKFGGAIDARGGEEEDDDEEDENSFDEEDDEDDEEEEVHSPSRSVFEMEPLSPIRDHLESMRCRLSQQDSIIQEQEVLYQKREEEIAALKDEIQEKDATILRLQEEQMIEKQNKIRLLEEERKKAWREKEILRQAQQDQTDAITQEELIRHSKELKRLEKTFRRKEEQLLAKLQYVESHAQREVDSLQEVHHSILAVLGEENDNLKEYLTEMGEEIERLTKRLTNREFEHGMQAFIIEAFSVVHAGSVLIKFSYGKSTRAKRFAQLLTDNDDYKKSKTFEIGWGSVSTMKINKRLSLKDVSAVLYGHASGTFKKHENLHEAPWLCFSLIASGRSYDFCALDTRHAFNWVLALRHAMHLQNNSRTAPTPGGILWERARLRLAHHASVYKISKGQALCMAVRSTKSRTQRLRKSFDPSNHTNKIRIAPPKKVSVVAAAVRAVPSQGEGSQPPHTASSNHHSGTNRSRHGASSATAKKDVVPLIA
jgi:chromosome segregation ATPase